MAPMIIELPESLPEARHHGQSTTAHPAGGSAVRKFLILPCILRQLLSATVVEQPVYVAKCLSWHCHSMLLANQMCHPVWE